MQNYQEDYHKSLHKNLLENKAYYLFRARYANITYLRYLKGRIFEFGCGIGQNIFLARERAIGIDISIFAVKECKKRGLNAFKSILELKGLYYDGCLSIHVLEHIEEPKEALKDINLRLKDGGKLVLVLPIFKKNVPERNNHGRDKSQHLHYWNFSAINALLVRSGFRVMANKFNYARGFSLFYGLPFGLAFMLTRMLGRITNTKEMIIVAEKTRK